MICPKCGSRHDNNSKMCVHCLELYKNYNWQRYFKSKFVFIVDDKIIITRSKKKIKEFIALNRIKYCSLLDCRVFSKEDLKKFKYIIQMKLDNPKVEIQIDEKLRYFINYLEKNIIIKEV